MRFLHRAAVTVAIVAMAALTGLALPVSAQTNLQYGSVVTGTTETSYQFTGKEGDLVSAEAVGISADLTPVLTLINMNGQQLGQTQNNPLTPGSTILNARLPLDGDYTLNVTDIYGRSGDFVLQLSARPITSAHALAEGRITVNIDATPQAFHFAAPAEIHLISPNSPFSAEIHSQPGELIALISDLPSAVFAIDSSGEYEMMLHTSGAATTVEIDYLLRPDLAPSPESPTAPNEQATASASLLSTDPRVWSTGSAADAN